VLVVDDQKAVRTALVVLLELHGLACLEAATPEEALTLVRREDVGVVIQDMNFALDTTTGAEGIELFRAIRQLDPELPIILLTAWSSLETAVALVKEGASDYVAKPWDDKKLVITVNNLLSLREARFESLRLQRRDTLAQAKLKEQFNLCGLIYQSPAMHEVVSLAVHVAPSDAAVLITGPNGSGKEKLAEIVQANSRRSDKPFIRVNAGGLPDTLLEAELFGAEAGAYTGASKARVGRFEAADGGTLFLDELANLSLSGQMKLLRVLQTGEYQRLGSNSLRKSDVRVISATNASLTEEIKAGRFREDLYFRLNVIELRLPALRDRGEDIGLLATHLLEDFAPGQPPKFTAEALAALEAYDWPGNVRELANRVQRALLVCDGGPITPLQLGLGDAETPNELPMNALALDTREAPEGDATHAMALDSAERAVVEGALERAAGVVSRAAAELGLSRQALYRRMQRLGITVERRVR